MIFVTVGTHEQPFDRLMKEIEKYRSNHDEEVIVQYGYSTYIPKSCTSSKMLSSDDMTKYVNEARIVITHGGPGSIMAPLLVNKKPIVVPRQSQIKEHVNDHQVKFVEHLAKENKVIAIYDIKDLIPALESYQNNNIELDIKGNTKRFVEKFENDINALFN